MGLNNAVAVVTGGASGLGLASVKRLIAGGGRVLIVDLERSNGAAVAAELGHDMQFAAADVADEASMTAAVAQAEAVGALPDPGLPPTVEPARHRAHWTIAPRQLMPRRTGAMDPQSRSEFAGGLRSAAPSGASPAAAAAPAAAIVGPSSLLVS
jgi:NAD(P)-dependent dehydrogenase (short-subunit alcohol dehydrogenase family)